MEAIANPERMALDQDQRIASTVERETARLRGFIRRRHRIDDTAIRVHSAEAGISPTDGLAEINGPLQHGDGPVEQGAAIDAPCTKLFRCGGDAQQRLLQAVR